MIKKFTGNVWLMFFLLTFLCSCSATRYKNALFKSYPQNTENTKSVYVVNSKESNSDPYLIKPYDILSIRNIQSLSYISSQEANSEPPLATTYRVESDGSVTLPGQGIGRVTVSGLTRKEASDKIQAIYSEKLLRAPIIEITVVNLKVTLLGEFIKQGNYALNKENTNLIDVIGEAGGITLRADPKTLKIIRGDKANPEIIYIDLTDVASLANPKLILRNDDIIYLEPLGVYNASERVSIFASFIQPVLLIVNTALIVYSFTRQ